MIKDREASNNIRYYRDTTAMIDKCLLSKWTNEIIRKINSIQEEKEYFGLSLKKNIFGWWKNTPGTGGPGRYALWVVVLVVNTEIVAYT